MTREEFQKLTEGHIILLDGATGTNMMKAGMPRHACAEAWILEHPEAIGALQKAYAEAGSRIVYAPTFSANRISLAKHHLEKDAERLNSGLVRLSREAVGPDVLVAGDMTTTGEMLDPLGDLTEEELLDAYREQALYLDRAGVDLFVAETLMCVREAELALQAVRSICDKPFMCTLTVQENGRAWFGGSAAELAEKLPAQGADAVGINCSGGPEQMLPLIEEMVSVSSVPVIAKPNAGLPVTDGQGNSVYSMDEDAFAGHMKRIAAAGARIIGGCCGTAPSYIRKCREVLGAAG